MVLLVKIMSFCLLNLLYCLCEIWAILIAKLKIKFNFTTVAAYEVFAIASLGYVCNFDGN